MKSDIGEPEEEALKNCSCELGVLTQCDGSAILCNGPAAVLAATFGPVEVRPQKELVDRAYIEVTFRGHQGTEAVEHRRVEQLVRCTLEECVFTALHPRTMIAVTLTVLETEPTLLLSTCVNAACLALLDAALPMKYVPAAVTCVPAGDRVLVNPLPAELQGADSGSVTAVFNPTTGQLVSTQAAGRLTAEQLAGCLAEGRRAAALISALYRRTVRSKLAKEPREPWAGPTSAEDAPAAWRRPGAPVAADDA